MSANQLATLGNNLPAYLAERMNRGGDTVQNLIDGIGGGMPDQIILKGTRFMLKTNDSEEVIKDINLDCVILTGRKGMSKAWYTTKYDPNQSEGKAPDCYSLFGERPEANSPLKQSESCAGCPMNQFNTGTAADGSAGKGKACSDNKIMAIFYKGKIWQMKVPPASLRALGDYGAQLARHNVQTFMVMTRISFNDRFDYPVLTFEYAGILPEPALVKMEEFLLSDEVERIAHPIPTTTAATNAAGASGNRTPAQTQAQPQTQPQGSGQAETPMIDPMAALGLGSGGPAPESKPTVAPAQKVADKEPAVDTVVNTAGEPDWANLTVKDLKSMAKDLGMKGYSKLSADELSDAVYEAYEAANDGQDLPPLATTPPPSAAVEAAAGAKTIEVEAVEVADADDIDALAALGLNM